MFIGLIFGIVVLFVFVIAEQGDRDEALKKADEVLQQGVQGVTDLINCPGLINLDFADIQTVMKDKGIENITDDKEIREVIKRIITENPDSVNDYKNGHDRAIKYLMGQIMKETKGGANPALVMSILKDKLDK